MHATAYRGVSGYFFLSPRSLEELATLGEKKGPIRTSHVGDLKVQ